MRSRSKRMPGCRAAWVSESLADEAREKFWRRVAEFEEGPFTTNFEQLTNAGVELPAPETLNDAALTTKLWEVIGRLARVSVFISHTNHLSDRELYTRLFSDWLREEIPESSDDDDGVWHVDPLLNGSEESIRLFLKYYASERERQDWLESEAGYVMPPHEEPASDRDRHLPKPYHGLTGDVN